MQRRSFIKTLSGGIILLAAHPLEAATTKRRKPLRFGIVTDTHYAERDLRKNRYYRQSIQKLEEAVDKFNQSQLDFAIELGDLKDMNPARKEDTPRMLDDIERVFSKFKGDRFHALGNHDMDSLSKAQFLSHTRNAGQARGKSYYSFVKKGIRCIVLDANFRKDLTPYDHGNFTWKEAYLPPEEIEWLKKELSRDKKPVIVFVHQLLDKFSGVTPSECVGNAEQVVALLEKNPHVLAVFQGHRHKGHYSHRGHIHYWTMKGMIESPYPEHNSYAIVEVATNGDIHISGYKDCESRVMIS